MEFFTFFLTIILLGVVCFLGQRQFKVELRVIKLRKRVAKLEQNTTVKL